MLSVSRNMSSVDVPTATRSRTPGWRDPRLWVGVALVAGSVVAGARIMATADDASAVWATSRDMEVGQPVTAEDLTATRVRFADIEDGSHYLGVEEQLPDELTLTRSLDAGELVPVGALGADPGAESVAVSIAVPPEHVPTGLAAGSHIDVWVLEEGRGLRKAAELVLADVVILDAPVVSDSFATSGSRQLVLAVPVDEQDALARVLAAGAGDLVRVVGRS